MRHWICWTLLVCVISGCSASKVYPGDKVEQRDCRWCGGSGVERGESYEGSPPPGVKVGGACVGCKGARKLRVVLPGPKHPAWLKGTVRDAEKVRGMPVEVELNERINRTQPVLGAVAGARLRFQGAGKAVEVTSAPSGRYRVLLEPGDYKVTITASGFADCQGEAHVAPRTAPIWDERARLVTPEQEADTSQADFLLSH